METKYTYEQKGELIEDINKLKGYEGYVQFSHRPLEQKDIFDDKDKAPNVAKDEKGFIYEAHFCNGQESIMIRQQNAEWVVSKTPITLDESNVEIKFEYFAFEKTSLLKDIKANWVKMAQIWQSEPDDLCNGMNVKKLKKVVFAGFADEGGSND